MKRRAYNQRKMAILRALDGRGWLNPPAIAILAAIQPVRAVYFDLTRYARWGLLRRRRDLRGLLAYRLSAKGAQRLAWLSRGWVNEGK